MNFNLNLVGLDKDDALSLTNSYNAIKKNGLELVEDKSLLQHVFSIFELAGLFDKRASVRFVNTFRISNSSCDYFIIQVEIDFGYKYSPKYGQRDKGRECQIWGFATCNGVFGRTILRPLTFMDRMINRFTSERIQFDNSPTFNLKYYLISSEKQLVLEKFDRPFITSLERTENLMLLISGQNLILGFPQIISNNITVDIQRILSSANFLKKTTL